MWYNINENLNMSNDKIIETLQENVLILKLNRPKKKNALDIDMFVQITKGLNKAATDENIKIVVLTGAEDFYSSGFDLSSERGNNLYVALEAFIKSFITFPKLLIAIVNGPAIGIAATTLALCDLVYASENAYFYTPFTKLGAAAEGCSSVTFPRLMGERKAMEMLILNYKMPAIEALEYGFINKVYKLEELQKKSWETIRTILNLPQPSVLYTKKLLKTASVEELLRTNEIELSVLRKLNGVGKSKL
ncbi:enoyl-CoA delta isomerase 2 [Danaus plexippus]|uniref:Crotonobetainyl-CoA-hydratase n=1 Tax=Danaus plexippus plexippus TaxID=278856 RepID=A0A212FJH2_DANPL|nr:enoyl-CoA delta isomerase 2 [Danaus plexippus]OWR53881.1 putative crotonobetainyl-CoA-hydratase [Danaus plexippus plexippus]